MSETPKRPGMLSVVKKAIRSDGWLNILTGLGRADKDKRVAGDIEYHRMSEAEVESLYAADDVAAALVDTLPDDALREGWTYQGFDDGQGKDVETAMDKLGARPAFGLAWKWSRIYGAAMILINVDDSQDLAKPLDMTTVREVKSLTVLSRWELQPKNIDVEINSATYGRPLSYTITPRRGDVKISGQEIHYSRLLRFDGVKLPMRLEIANNYWGDSVLNRTFNAIRNYNTSHDSAATVLQEFNQGVFKIKGLAEMIYSGNDEAVRNRLEMVNLSRSICRSVVIDMDETFENLAASVTGIPDMLSKVGDRLVVASRMPHTKILGQSPSGLGATGDSEEKNWYDHVSSQQELILLPKLKRLTEIVLASRKGPTSGKAPKNWDVEFCPLWQMSDKESADLRKVQADTDAVYISNGVLDPDEVAIARFGHGKYSTETTIDVASREKSPIDPAQKPPAGGAA